MTECEALALPTSSPRHDQDRGALAAKKFRRRCCWQVNDELIFEVPDGEVAATCRSCSRCAGRTVPACCCRCRLKVRLAGGQTTGDEATLDGIARRVLAFVESAADRSVFGGILDTSNRTLPGRMVCRTGWAPHNQTVTRGGEGPSPGSGLTPSKRKSGVLDIGITGPEGNIRWHAHRPAGAPIWYVGVRVSPYFIAILADLCDVVVSIILLAVRRQGADSSSIGHAALGGGERPSGR